MNFTKATAETNVPQIWYICKLNGVRQPMRFEKHTAYLDDSGIPETYGIWWDMFSTCYLAVAHDIYFLNDLENEEFKNFDLAQ